MTFRMGALLGCLCFSAVGNVHPQDPSLFADLRLYEGMLERLLQHEVQPRSSEIELRYTHSNAGEMQIVAHRLSNDDFRLEVRYVPAGSPTLWNQLAKVATSQPTLTPEGAAQLMKIEQKRVVAKRGTPLGKLLDAAESVSIPVVNRNLFPLEGMKYGFALRSAMEEITLTIWGPQAPEKSEYELIRWMGQVRLGVETLLKGS